MVTPSQPQHPRSERVRAKEPAPRVFMKPAAELLLSASSSASTTSREGFEERHGSRSTNIEQ